MKMMALPKPLKVVIAFFLLSGLASSQSTDSSHIKRFEIGGHFVFLNRSNADPVFEILRREPETLPGVHPATVSEFGLGGRFGVNFTKYVSAEVEANVFPDDKQRDTRFGVPIRVLEPGGRKFQMLFGPKIGVRFSKFGVFGKVRPGFIRLDRFEAIDDIFRNQNEIVAILSSTRKGLTFFNLDIGGVVEYYPSKRTILRFDIGDTIIRYNAQQPKELNPDITHHNLQLSMGFGFRF